MTTHAALVNLEKGDVVVEKVHKRGIGLLFAPKKEYDILDPAPKTVSLVYNFPLQWMLPTVEHCGGDISEGGQAVICDHCIVLVRLESSQTPGKMT